jgi:Zn-dependent membrane protease YugP
MNFIFAHPSFLLLIPALVFAIWTQWRIRSTYSRYSRVKAAGGLTGAEVAKRLLGDAGLVNVSLKTIEGQLTDHYDPRKKTLRLSASIAQGRSVAAIGIAAHEVGHALQHQSAYTPFMIRQSLFPVANLGSTLAFPLFFIGFIFSSFSFLMDIGIVLFAGAVLFQVVTLPVELNASSRALQLLTNRLVLNKNELIQARHVLRAAALTYVAATAMAVTHLLRLLLLQNSRD